MFYRILQDLEAVLFSQGSYATDFHHAHTCPASCIALIPFVCMCGYVYIPHCDN